MAKKPSVSVRSRGTYTDMMEAIQGSYKEKNPGRSLRWVYAPEDRQDFSKLIRRRALGYEPVKLSDVDEGFLLGQSTGDVVRVGDVILMSIPTELQKRYARELKEAAEDQTKQIERSYYDQVHAAVDPKGRSAKPFGKITSGTEVRRAKEQDQEEEEED